MIPAAGAANSTPWVPISRSAIHLNLNQTIAPGPSYNESFFMTVVHEMGHALGLQRTRSHSATMSTATTRATSLSNPIDADDIAGISVLYPNANFAQTGSIFRPYHQRWQRRSSGVCGGDSTRRGSHQCDDQS